MDRVEQTAQTAPWQLSGGVDRRKQARRAGLPPVTESGHQRHRQGLEQLVDVLAKELLRAKAAAEAAKVAKRNFLANMSHEMRTPLQQIIGMSALIRRDPLTPRQAERLYSLDASSRHLTGIIEAILILTNLEAGKLELIEQPIDLPALIDEVVATTLPQADAKQLPLLVEAGPDLGNFLGDAGHIRLALTNYLNNAIRFTKVGIVTVRSRLVKDDTTSALIRFEVEDTGIGIAPDDQARLFDMFEQVDNSSTRRFGGLGAGLAVTKRIAKLMGGDAGCDSRLGEGSLFWFTVSLKKH